MDPEVEIVAGSIVLMMKQDIALVDVYIEDPKAVDSIVHVSEGISPHSVIVERAMYIQ